MHLNHLQNTLNKLVQSYNFVGTRALKHVKSNIGQNF